MLKPHRRAIGISLGCALTLTLIATATVPAAADDHENLPGEPGITLPINDMPTGDLMFLDADYVLTVKNTGNGKK